MTSTTEENQEPKTVTLEDWQIQRDDFKAEGDAAFRAGGFRTAISAYSSAIDLDPDMVVLYSNRSAAYLANSESSKALRDAQKCVELDPAFAKGYSRLASALFALRRYDKAKEAYEQALEKESNNAAAIQGVEACNKELEKLRIQQQEDAQWEEAESKAPAVAEENVKKDKEEDDLADFFDEVEEVVTKQKEKVAAVMTAKPEATHAIRRTSAPPKIRFSVCYSPTMNGTT
jgi:tetratricopeptide (TPR) repeat protein